MRGDRTVTREGVAGTAVSDAVPGGASDATSGTVSDPPGPPGGAGAEVPGGQASSSTVVDLRDPSGRRAWLDLPSASRRRLVAGHRRTYTQVLDWATELVDAGQLATALTVLDGLGAAPGRAPFVQADVLRVLRRVVPPVDVPAQVIRDRAWASLRDVEARPELLRTLPDLPRLVARVLLALGDRRGVIEVATFVREYAARMARGYGDGPLERMRDDMVLASMLVDPGYAEAFAGLAPAVFTDAATAVRLAPYVRRLRLRRPSRLPEGMDRLVAVETVELEGAGDGTTVAWLTWLAGRAHLHTLELSGAAQRLVADERLLAALLVAPGLRRLRIGYPSVNPWSMRALMADLRSTGAPPRTRLLQLALLRGDMDYVLARARTADLVAALDSRVAGVRGAALHLLEGVFGAPAVRFGDGDDVLVCGTLEDTELLADRLDRWGVRLSREVGPRTRLAVIAEHHEGRALDLLDTGLPLICEGQLRAVLDRSRDGAPEPQACRTSSDSAGVSTLLASTDGVTVAQALNRLVRGRAGHGAFEGLIVVATNPRLDRSLRQTARRLLVRDAPADLVDAAADVAEIVRALDRTGTLSTWELQETGVETDGLVDVVTLTLLLLRVRSARRLDLVHAGITQVPPDVLQLHLTELSLAGNRLTTLPARLGQCTDLVGLDVGHNALTDFPDPVRRMTWLRRLDISAGPVPRDEPDGWPRLARGLDRLLGLRELTLDGHRLTVLPEAIRGMADLERLALRRGHLGALPEWLLRSPRLGWLALDGTSVDEADAARDVLAGLRRRGVVVSAWPTEQT